MTTRTVTAYDWVPDFAQGHVRDLRVRWALEEEGLPYETDLLPQGTQGKPENLARQPFGQVPALTVDGKPMFESGACVWRIAEEGTVLLPKDTETRNACLSWHFAALNSVEPSLTMMAMLFFQAMNPDIGEEGVAKVRPGIRSMAEKRLTQLADALGERDHLVADRFTTADLMMTTVLRTAESLDLLEPLPRLRAYLDHHTARPAFRAALEAQLQPFRENAPRYERAG
ncbi:glutathione S-transferase family protein [Pararhizobium mangrovi]|uniref:Glutathione S-transferase family protein n=1 Tax=Pararhizobium mangrovi TaxID=2590452 RepID=A0A506U0E8_9HYPH|nr:glutathione S-transferase family protein [Pararhizobium mangrovi]TPW26445.1 glutathione S-transferase family protein [Pararhizobium mangrovi]